jgi:hypothetical protein
LWVSVKGKQIPSFWLQAELHAFFGEYCKSTEGATSANPRLGALFKEVKKRERHHLQRAPRSARGSPIVARLLAWKTEAEDRLIDPHLCSLVEPFEKRCRARWIEYAGRLSPKYLHQMEEALHWGRVDLGRLETRTHYISL